MKHKPKPASAIYDVLYGFVPLTACEAEIIDSPFFQRLRWIKQLGFANYIFPGAEHTRFAHSIGVMHSMHQMIRALGIGVSDDELFHPKSKSNDAQFHRLLRLSALLHDLGTFPFSHAVEYAYLRHGADPRVSIERKKEHLGRAATGHLTVNGSDRNGFLKNGPSKLDKRRSPKTDAVQLKKLPNNHEHLGSFIIKNTNYENGITQILMKYGFDPKDLSDTIKGHSKSILANQLMHSDLDADRMDYLIRDAHYTGLKYGAFDRDFILSNLELFNPSKKAVGIDGLQYAIKESALHTLEDFLIARWNWYTQIIRNTESAKFDILSTQVAKRALEANEMFQFGDLLEMIESGNERFYWWNDLYFMNRCETLYFETKDIKKHRMFHDLIKRILFRNPPRTVRHELFEQKLISCEKNQHAMGEYRAKVEKFAAQLSGIVAKNGDFSGDSGTSCDTPWLFIDIPDRDIRPTQSLEEVVSKRKNENLLTERDPSKIMTRSGEVKLLVEHEQSTIRVLSNYVSFCPAAYANESGLKLIEKALK